jgi:hypothetical protein
VRVYTEEEAEVVVYKDTLQTKNNKVKFETIRSSDSLQLQVISKDTTHLILVAPKNSEKYYANVLSFGLGFIIDSRSSKRYEYPGRIYLYNEAQGGISYSDYRRYAHKGDLDLHFSISLLNMFMFNPRNSNTVYGAGLLGYNYGIEYYYHSERFINLMSGNSLDLLLNNTANEVVVSQGFQSFYVNLTHNHVYNDKWSWGYGLSYARNMWDRTIVAHGPYGLFFHNYESFEKDKLGLEFNVHHRFHKRMMVGLVYRPSFVEIDDDNDFLLDFESQLSLNFAWKMQLN